MNALITLVACALTQHCTDHPQGDCAAACDEAIQFLMDHGCSRDNLRRFPARVRRELKRQGVVARLTAAHPLHETALHRLAPTLEQAVGRRTELVTAVDPALIGGAVLTVGDDRLDGSIRGALVNLKNHLTM